MNTSILFCVRCGKALLGAEQDNRLCPPCCMPCRPEVEYETSLDFSMWPSTWVGGWWWDGSLGQWTPDEHILKDIRRKWTPAEKQ